jgi:hypothetical protein
MTWCHKIGALMMTVKYIPFYVEKHLIPFLAPGILHTAIKNTSSLKIDISSCICQAAAMARATHRFCLVGQPKLNAGKDL